MSYATMANTVLQQANMPAGIGSRLATPKASGVKLKWKKNADVTAPLMEYSVDDLSMKATHTFAVRLKFNPAKLKKWEIEVAGKKSAYFDGTRTDVVKMQLAAEAMLEQLQKEAA